MANNTSAAIFQEDNYFDGLPQVVTAMSTSGVTAADIRSNIDLLFSDLYTGASGGLVLQASLGALNRVRDTWRFMQENTDELTSTGFHMQLADRILHDASIYGLGQDKRHALAIRELVFNLNFAYSQDGPTPLNLGYLRRKLVTLLDQLDTHMQAGGVRRPQPHNLQPATSGQGLPHASTMPDSKSRYTNLCAFASDLTREDIDLSAWEDIMTAAVRRARNNMPSKVPPRDDSGRLETCKAYLGGAEAWVSRKIVQKSLLGQRVSREAWRLWQDMFAEANGATTTLVLRDTRDPLLKASRQIERALGGVDGHNEARHPRRSSKPKPRPLRIPTRT